MLFLNFSIPVQSLLYISYGSDIKVTDTVLPVSSSGEVERTSAHTFSNNLTCASDVDLLCCRKHLKRHEQANLSKDVGSLTLKLTRTISAHDMTTEQAPSAEKDCVIQNKRVSGPRHNVWQQKAEIQQKHVSQSQVVICYFDWLPYLMWAYQREDGRALHITPNHFTSTTCKWHLKKIMCIHTTLMFTGTLSHLENKTFCSWSWNTLWPCSPPSWSSRKCQEVVYCMLKFRKLSTWPQHWYWSTPLLTLADASWSLRAMEG